MMVRRALVAAVIVKVSAVAVAVTAKMAFAIKLENNNLKSTMTEL